MEKIKLVMDMIENPEKYSEAQIEDFLQDEECRQTYLTMMEIRMAYDKKDAEEELDLDLEWKGIRDRHASESRFAWRKMAVSFVGVLLLSGVAFAAIHTFSSRHDDTRLALADTTVAKSVARQDTLSSHYQKNGGEGKLANRFSKTFDNVSLSSMLAEMAKHYGVAVEYHKPDAKQLRFYYEWNSGDELQKVLDELNHSQQVSLSLENGAIIVE